MSAGAISVELREISKRLGRSAPLLYENFRLSVAAGETVAIVGPSGSGKSTLLNLIALVDDVDAGEIFHHGQLRDVRDQGRLSLGYIFQRDALLPWATVLQNVLLGAECRGLSRSVARASAIDLLARFGISKLKDRLPSSLSGGQRQLVALAQNLLVEPDLLLLDEPFAHLDFPSKLMLEAELLKVIRTARQRRPMTTIIVTHDIEEAIVIADRIAVIGGYPSRPTQIVRWIEVETPYAERDPIRMREGEWMARYFRETWDAIEALTPALGEIAQ